jgi:hypothetical protein
MYPDAVEVRGERFTLQSSAFIEFAELAHMIQTQASVGKLFLEGMICFLQRMQSFYKILL